MLSYEEKSKEYFDNKTVMKLLAKGYSRGHSARQLHVTKLRCN